MTDIWAEAPNRCEDYSALKQLLDRLDIAAIRFRDRAGVDADMSQSLDAIEIRIGDRKAARVTHANKSFTLRPVPGVAPFSTSSEGDAFHIVRGYMETLAVTHCTCEA